MLLESDIRANYLGNFPVEKKNEQFHSTFTNKVHTHTITILARTHSLSQPNK